LKLYFCNVTILEKKGKQEGRKEERKRKEILVKRKRRFPSGERNKRNND